MDIGTVLWTVWIAAFFCIEGYALITNKYDTLSEKIRYVNKKHWTLRVITFLTCLWAGVHLYQECALGMCFK